MCGRYGYADPAKFKKRYSLLSDEIGLKPRYNIAPGQNIPVVIKDKTNKLEVMKWGFVPSWSKDLTKGVINARAEGIAEKPYFRQSFKEKRCLVPASFFYEWYGEGSERVPYLFKMTSPEIFSLAGIYDVIEDAEGKLIKTYAIITTEPNAVVKKVHNRMPVILSQEDESRWLDLAETEDDLINLLKPYPANKMTSFLVSRLVNNPVNDFEGLTSPVDL